MLDQQKRLLKEKYSDYILKLEPFLLRISGYNPQDTNIQIGNNRLFCTPGTFSLTDCKVLLFLTPKEVGLFKGLEKKLISLNLAFDSTYFGKPISFFLKGKIESLITIRENVYTLDLSLNSTSDTYKELFLHLAEVTSLYKKVYHTKLTPLQEAGIKQAPLTYCQIVKNKQIISYVKLNNISPRHLEFTLKNQETTIDVEQKYNYIMTYNGRPINLTGTIVKKEGDNFISTIELNMEYIHIITIYMNMYQKQESQVIDTEEGLEEL